MFTRKIICAPTIIAGFVVTAAAALSQALPGTPGETLSGKHIVLADAVRGHSVVLILGFSKDAADGCGEWAKAVRGDSAFSAVGVYQVAMLEKAPSFVRGTIKDGMRKGVAAANQDSFVVLVQDEKLWRSHFGVSADKEPYVSLIDAAGRVLWRGHGAAKDLEPLLKSALK